MKKFLLTLLCAAGLATASNAAVSELYTVQFGSSYRDPNIGSYTDSWTATRDGKEWKLVNFNNNNNKWNYVKCGRKNVASVATITSNAALADKISSVAVTIDKMTVSSVNSIKLSVAGNSDFTDAVDVTADSKDFKKGGCTLNFTVATPAADKYYKLTFDCAAASDNGVIQLSKVVFSGEAGESPEYKVATPELTMEKGEGTIRWL